MKMELIQPFINSLDAVIAETMGCSAEIADVTMEEGTYLRTGVAALVNITGIIFIFLLPQRPKGFARNDFGKTNNRIQGRAKLMTYIGKKL